jgi:NAD(P)-binding Rossmann-like domain
MPIQLEVDYLIIGAGAMGMAFADTLITETNASVLIVDRHHRPGGHWNNAYPFVRLHAPSSYYGVNSRLLGTDTVDCIGWNKGLRELASDSEICAYYEQVMQQQFLPSGRVSWFPMCEYQGASRFKDYVGREYCVDVRCRIVDATYMHVSVPSMRPPPYEVAAKATSAPPNDLPKIKRQHGHYTIVGAGKTGMDACLWLLRHNVDPADLTWIMPRDSWMMDRANIQTGAAFAQSVLTGFLAQSKAIGEATSLDDLFNRLSAAGRLLRLDEEVRPTMYHCAIVSRAELDQLRRIKDIVRLGRVQRIESHDIFLDCGKISTSPDTLHVDCSADGLAQRRVTPVFNGQTITLQSVRTCQQVFSAAFIAHVEASYQGDDTKNSICTPIPHPGTDLDWLRTTIANNRNQLRWTQDEGLLAWLDEARLNGFRARFAPLPTETAARARAKDAMRKNIEDMNEKLNSLLREASE